MLEPSLLNDPTASEYLVVFVIVVYMSVATMYVYPSMALRMGYNPIRSFIISPVWPLLYFENIEDWATQGGVCNA